MILYQRLKDRITKDIATFKQELAKQDSDPSARKHLVLLAGNGLTRLAALRAGIQAPSWERWVKQSLTDSGALQSFEYLRRRGHDLPAIFGVAARKAEHAGDSGETIRKIWRSLWDIIIKVEKTEFESPQDTIHRCLFALTKNVITTNYDRVFEAALAATNQLAGRVVRVPTFLGGDPMLADQYRKSTGTQVEPPQRIFKIHGSLPPPTPTRSFMDCLSDNAFEDWICNEGHLKTITHKSAYEYAGFMLRSEDFEKQYSEVISLLKDEKSLVAILGLGLGGEEFILSRLLQTTGMSRRALLLWTGSKLEFEASIFRLEAYPVFIDQGLAASTARRFAATVAFLDVLLTQFNLIGVTKSDTLITRLLSVLDDATKEVRPAVATTKSIRSIQPEIIVVGQAAVNRVIGLEVAPSQEAAYAPRQASRDPMEERGGASDYLIAERQIGGQGGTPALLWDALGIPASLVGFVGDDDFSDMILGRLSSSEFLEFNKLAQRAMPSESATVVTWYGIRNIFEGPRGFAGHKFANDRELVDALRYAKVFYVTKVSSDEWPLLFDQCSPDARPQIVFDTGGTTNSQAEITAANSGGIVVASAVAFLRYPDYAKWPNDTAFVQHWRNEKEPKNDTGRVVQAGEVINYLKTLQAPWVPPFLQGLLKGARAYAVTLGELGLIYWINGGKGWSAPCWVTANQAGGQDFPLSEVRDSFGCGDCARAGIAATLAAHGCCAGSKQFADKEIAQAFCAGVWFGTNKVRFFGLEPYLNELRNQRQEITEAFMQLNVTSSPVTLGRNSLALDIIHTCQNVIEALEKALGQFKLTYEGNLLKWQKARKIH